VDTKRAGDNELISSNRLGKKEAFQLLYSRYKDSAFFYALNLVHDEHRAEEAVQDAFMALLKKGKSFTALGAFRSYLFSAVRSRAIDALRKVGTRREVFKSSTLDLFEKEEQDGDKPLAPESAGMVSEALLTLPAEQREAVVLKIYNSMTFNEIAELTGVSSNTVASRYRYGCEKLKAKLNGILTNG